MQKHRATEQDTFTLAESHRGGAKGKRPLESLLPLAPFRDPRPIRPCLDCSTRYSRTAHSLFVRYVLHRADGNRGGPNLTQARAGINLA